MIFFVKRGKGQSSLEFLVLISFALILISGLLVVFQNQVSNMESVREKALVEQMHNLVLSELDFALISPPVYNRTFFLPRTLGGHNYDISIVEGVEIVLDYRGVKSVFFLASDQYDLLGNFQRGRNVLIKHVDNKLVLNDPNYVPAPPPDPEDPDPDFDVTLRVNSIDRTNNQEITGVPIKYDYGGSLEEEKSTPFSLTPKGETLFRLRAPGEHSDGEENYKFREWDGCDQVFDSDCEITLGAGSTNAVVTAYYVSAEESDSRKSDNN